ncbi:DUF1045 domain-containing protein [Litoreibacter roseus]|uniref:Phosphonate metabolism protein n=1 Tax=Litoreibacter roseus TaxID=2601869 RepID=A0A6N6JJ28_9RHOB|nr:DUF1045 domain-containing protein [Litoreibacter roseus]GFE66134.1 phosphonate metabolism protein [Litoreibacter roseus]
MSFERYAIYVTPEPGPLADFGAAWLGWDMARGCHVAHPDLEGLPRPVSEITATPRKYGLHGTIKPPFYLANGTTMGDLQANIATFCATQAPVELAGLKVAELGHFVALVPEGDTANLGRLAGTCVKKLDNHRAPPSADELARRRAAGLTSAQNRHLERWGYPYVMEEFRFHITLTGRLLEEDNAAVRLALEAAIAPILPKPFAVKSLTLAGSDTTGMFHEIHRYTLSG